MCSCNCNKKCDERMKELKEFIEVSASKNYPKSYLIAVLHKAQELYGYLDRTVMEEIALYMGIPASQIWGVATFYHYFNLKPQGEHSIFVCMGTACYVKGAAKVLDAIKSTLNIQVGETTSDGLFTLHEARCIGSCGLAPVVMIDDKVYGDLTPDMMKSVLEKYRKEKN